ncbi:MAG: GNAT family N-acetyltransferase [Spongiibacteraceae bacterium]
MDRSSSNYQISFKPLVDTSQLAAEWQALELCSANEFFLSWLWIGTWLEVFKPAVNVLRVTQSDQVVALALITHSAERRHGWLRSNILRLHQTGEQIEDQIWIEYNDILIATEHRGLVEQRCVEFLLAQVAGWDELVLGASSDTSLQNFSHPQLFEHIRWTAPSYGVDLAALREQGISYLQSRSKNTRAQIRRAHRDAQALGEISFTAVTDTEQALQAFDAIGSLHKQRWGDDSGFNNAAFVAFHQCLISRAMPAGNIEVFQFNKDGELIAGLYNFLYRGKVYFYLSGINYQGTESIKPGLLCHAECIQAHQSAGKMHYDFMGGDARYKRSLGQHTTDLKIIAFQKKTAGLWLEQKLRRLKGLIVHE